MRNVRTIAAVLHQTDLLLSGLAAHAEKLAGCGLNTDFATGLTAKYQKMLDANIAQQAFLSRMKEKTEERQVAQAELLDMYAKARKLVKLEMPQESWREFGIEDQR